KVAPRRPTARQRAWVDGLVACGLDAATWTFPADWPIVVETLTRRAGAAGDGRRRASPASARRPARGAPPPPTTAPGRARAGAGWLGSGGGGRAGGQAGGLFD